MTAKKMTKKEIEESKKEFYGILVEKVARYLLEKNPDYLFVVKNKNIHMRVRVSKIPDKYLKFALRYSKYSFRVATTREKPDFVEKNFLNFLLSLIKVLKEQNIEFLKTDNVTDNDIIVSEMLLL